jgi:hypothetical protein
MFGLIVTDVPDDPEVGERLEMAGDWDHAVVHITAG